MMTLNNYHYNPTTNRMNICTAKQYNCPLSTLQLNINSKKTYETQHKQEMITNNYLGKTKKPLTHNKKPTTTYKKNFAKTKNFTFESKINEYNLQEVTVTDKYGGKINIIIRNLPEIKTIGSDGKNLTFEPKNIIETAPENWENKLLNTMTNMLDGRTNEQQEDKFYKTIALMYREVRENEKNWKNTLHNNKKTS